MSTSFVKSFSCVKDVSAIQSGFFGQYCLKGEVIRGFAFHQVAE